LLLVAEAEEAELDMAVAVEAELVDIYQER
jgi:hypothetical protein